MSKRIKLSRTKAFYLFSGTLAIAFILHWIPPSLLFDPDALMQHLDMQQCGVCIFVVAQVVATVLGLPGTVLVIAGGAIFGLVWGTIWSTLGSTVGAIVAFYAARYFLRDWVVCCFGHQKAVQQLNQMMSQNSLSCVLAVRFAPVSPFNVMNFLFGLTPVSLRTYTIGTFLGIIPGTFIYTGLGVSGRKALAGEGVFYLSLSLFALALLSILPVLLKRLRSR